MAFFLIGRGADDALQLLSANPFESRQDAMAELSRITSDAAFSQWDLEVFVVDLDAGVPVLLVRPQREQADVGAVVASTEAPEQTDAEEPETAAEVAEDLESEVEPTATTLEDIAEETRGNLREALQRTAEQMSSEGIVPPTSAGLESQEVPPESSAEEIDAPTPQEDDEPSEEEPAEAALEDVPSDADALPDTEAADEAVPSMSDTESGEPTWPWDAPTTTSTPEPGVSPEIATVYEGLEQMEAQESGGETSATVSEGTPLQAEGSDFILDLEAIQPVAMQPQGTDAAAPPTQPQESAAPDEPAEEPSQMAEQATESLSPDEIATPVEEPEEAPAQATEFPSSMTEYTCEDCVYVETCPNRDQREPKDCGSFQWK